MVTRSSGGLAQHPWRCFVAAGDGTKRPLKDLFCGFKGRGNRTQEPIRRRISRTSGGRKAGIVSGAPVNGRNPFLRKPRAAVAADPSGGTSFADSKPKEERFAIRGLRVFGTIL
eukprot:TRINITY_DN208_c0_g1_i6.p3 TRINITY_DN208_c0_g1~~TRINITY_DN208_c0_g1_i6.p3  ORF type:complete len:114 (+),score=2.54 TRINITY_DN208_c0_g1_i6:191-532(+)